MKNYISVVKIRRVRLSYFQRPLIYPNIMSFKFIISSVVKFQDTIDLDKVEDRRVNIEEEVPLIRDGDILPFCREGSSRPLTCIGP